MLSVCSAQIGLYSLCKEIPRLLFPTFTAPARLESSDANYGAMWGDESRFIEHPSLTMTNGRPRLELVRIPVVSKERHT